jgi:hypothetical protein
MVHTHATPSRNVINKQLCGVQACTAAHVHIQ